MSAAHGRLAGGVLAALALAAWAALGPPPVAAAATLEARVDPSVITLEETAMLEVVVEGAEGVPELPELPGFEARFLGRSSQWQMVNGRMSSSVTYTWSLTPRSTGTFRVPEITLRAGEETLVSQPLEVRVVEASARSASAEQDLFVTATVSDTSPWVGEQVLFVWRLYQAVEIAYPRLEPRSYDGFVVEELGEARRGDAVVDGRSYRVTEIRMALFPQEVGRLTVPSIVLRCEVGAPGRRPGSVFDDPFFPTRRQGRVLRTAEIELDVRPLPPAPPGFSGLVGEYSLDATLSKPRVAVGETTTLEVRLSGSGNLKMAPGTLARAGSSTPRAAEGRLKVYEEEPRVEISRRPDGVQGTKTFRTALVPLAAGELQVEPNTLVYFEPVSEEYRTATSPPFTLEVTPADAAEELAMARSPELGSEKMAVRVKPDELRPIRTGLEALRTGVEPDGPGWWLLLGLPPALFLAFAGLLRHRRRLAGDRAFARRRGARRGLEEFRRRVEAAEAQGRRDEATELASVGLRRLVGDLLDIEGVAMTADEIAAELVARSVSPDLARRVGSWLAALEAARYGGQETTESLSAGLAGLAAELEREVSR